jgi:hypothetical protein
MDIDGCSFLIDDEYGIIILKQNDISKRNKEISKLRNGLDCRSCSPCLFLLRRIVTNEIISNQYTGYDPSYLIDIKHVFISISMKQALGMSLSQRNVLPIILYLIHTIKAHFEC